MLTMKELETVCSWTFAGLCNKNSASISSVSMGSASWHQLLRYRSECMTGLSGMKFIM